MADVTPSAEKDVPVCGTPRRYFCQETCELPAGHSGEHESAVHIWKNVTSTGGAS